MAYTLSKMYLLLTKYSLCYVPGLYSLCRRDFSLSSNLCLNTIYFSQSFHNTCPDPQSMLCIFFFAISWAALAAYGGSQARGLIGAVASSLRHSHSNTGSEPKYATYTTAHGNADP